MKESSERIRLDKSSEEVTLHRAGFMAYFIQAIKSFAVRCPLYVWPFESRVENRETVGNPLIINPINIYLWLQIQSNFLCHSLSSGLANTFQFFYVPSHILAQIYYNAHTKVRKREPRRSMYEFRISLTCFLFLRILRSFIELSFIRQ